MMRRGAGSFKLAPFGSQETRRVRQRWSTFRFRGIGTCSRPDCLCPTAGCMELAEGSGGSGASHEPFLPRENIVRRALRLRDPVDDIAVCAELRAGPRPDRHPEWSAARTDSSSSPLPQYEASGAYRLRYFGRPCLPSGVCAQAWCANSLSREERCDPGDHFFISGALWLRRSRSRQRRPPRLSWVAQRGRHRDRAR